MHFQLCVTWIPTAQPVITTITGHSSNKLNHKSFNHHRISISFQKQLWMFVCHCRNVPTAEPLYKRVHSKFAKPYFSQATWYKTLSLITKKKPQTDQQKLQKASLRLLQKMRPSVGAAETTKAQATHCYRVESCLTYDLWENTDTPTTKYWKWGPCLGLLLSENKGWKSYRSCQTQIL